MSFNGNYHIIPFQECPKCKEYEKDFVSKNCGFSLETIGNKVVQTFNCCRCQHTWVNVWKKYTEKEEHVRKEIAECNI